jgi:hypothetical protein
MAFAVTPTSCVQVFSIKFLYYHDNARGERWFAKNGHWELGVDGNPWV